MLAVYTPPIMVSGAEPRTLLKVVSTNCTVPVGVPDPGAGTLTTAVNATCWVEVEDTGKAARVVAVGALFTICVTVGDVLAP